MSQRDRREGAIEALTRVFDGALKNEQGMVLVEAEVAMVVIREYAAQLAALPPEDDGWMPIATAPMEGWLLVDSREFGVRLGRQREDFHEYSDPAYLTLDGDHDITHWRPLPAPPKATPADPMP